MHVGTHGMHAGTSVLVVADGIVASMLNRSTCVQHTAKELEHEATTQTIKVWYGLISMHLAQTIQ